MRAPAERRTGDGTKAVLANLAIATPLFWAAVLHSRSATLYASRVQEDGVLEWMTAWGFIVAAAVFAAAARAEHRKRRRFPWFTLGLGLFCLLVALEEVSWGQRLLGYRPPVYFLEHNYQQELNLHNLVDTSLRKLALKSIIVGYGVALPLLAHVAPARRLLLRLGVWAPPIALVPGFAVTALTYQIYPLKFSGELVELMLSVSFLFSALSAPALGDIAGVRIRSRLARSRSLAIGTLVVILLGTAAGLFWTRVRRAHPGNADAARSESEALKRDLLSLTEANNGEPVSDCGLHRRVYTWVTKEDMTYLFESEFAGLRSQGLPEERADFFIDPWNSPYWIRHRCSSKRQRIMVYSFGANRRRESDAWEIRGDDIGAVIDIGLPDAP